MKMGGRQSWCTTKRSKARHQSLDHKFKKQQEERGSQRGGANNSRLWSARSPRVKFQPCHSPAWWPWEGHISKAEVQSNKDITVFTSNVTQIKEIIFRQHVAGLGTKYVFKALLLVLTAEFKPWLYHLLAVWHWVGCIPSMSLKNLTNTRIQ